MKWSWSLTLKLSSRSYLNMKLIILFPWSKCWGSIWKINLTLKWPWSLTSMLCSRSYLNVKMHALFISVVKIWGSYFKKINLTLKWPWSLTSRSRSKTYLDVKVNALSISVVKIWGSYLKKSMWHWNDLDPWPQGQGHHKLAPYIPYNFLRKEGRKVFL